MEVLKNEGPALERTEKKAAEVEKIIETSPVNTADIYPADKKARRKCTLSEEMIELLVYQMCHELENYIMYKTFAAYFYRNDLSKLGVYYDDRAGEENNHHLWIYNYLTECDAEFTYPQVPAINLDITDHVAPFRMTVDKEIETTLGINQIVNRAAEEGDWATFNFLLGDDPKTGRLVREQREEESISRTILGMAEMEGSWLRKQNSILEFYRNPDAEAPNEGDED